ncbi:MAG: GNAT family N-acetyltransferase [Muribaculaceae bacterium]|nr:GNAT family N-acetyltransferase [Muribaculaceae bacterium]
MKIRPATINDSPLIGYAITLAIGDDITANLAGDHHTTDEVADLFASLARRTDTQYSYLNTLVAVDDNDAVMGVAIAYDGALLHHLREQFIAAAEQKLDLVFEGELIDETDAEEFYLDTLAVFPEYRRQGIAGRLIKATAERAVQVGKPLGLLVDKDNERARRLYESSGFRYVGDRPFAGEMMDHLIMR